MTMRNMLQKSTIVASSLKYGAAKYTKSAWHGRWAVRSYMFIAANITGIYHAAMIGRASSPAARPGVSGNIAARYRPLDIRRFIGRAYQY